jgi:hypothetical protein
MDGLADRPRELAIELLSRLEVEVSPASAAT